MKKIIAFLKLVSQYLKEAWHRLGLPSPTFFFVLQWISGAAIFLSGLPALLLSYQAQLGITFPDWIFKFSNKMVTVGAVVGFIVSKFTVKNPNIVKIKDGETKVMLPFTNNK